MLINTMVAFQHVATTKTEKSSKIAWMSIQDRAMAVGRLDAGNSLNQVRFLIIISFLN